MGGGTGSVLCGRDAERLPLYSSSPGPSPRFPPVGSGPFSYDLSPLRYQKRQQQPAQASCIDGAGYKVL